MTDRELLELAAKAAAYNLIFDYDENLQGPSIIDADGFPEPWNPLTDDGDGARLEAALMYNVIWLPRRVGVNGYYEKYADHGGDRQKARRYAAVRAAAVSQLSKSQITGGKHE